MSYEPLARKYRPQTFSDLVGQDDTAMAIANGIKLGREARAVIFSGVRGIGKTTTARLYAKALNCENGPTPQPCNVCASCVAINAGSHEDVLEIDGASNTGVEDVRELRESVGYAPQRSKYKVYIIDEVHMLSQSAFNALLKTLEEPPDNVVFLFATTELHKIPQTIVSRCQTFFLSKFTAATIVKRLKHILELESVQSDERALQVIAKEAHGSMRDALTLLDQALAFGDGTVSSGVVEKFVSAVSTTTLLDFIQSCLQKDHEKLLQIVSDLDGQGVKFSSFVEDVAIWIRHCLITREVGSESLDIEILALDSEELSRLKEIAGVAQPMEFNRLFRAWFRCIEDLTGSVMDRYVIENIALEWCLDPGLPTIEGLKSGQGISGTAATRPSNQPASPTRQMSTQSVKPPTSSKGLSLTDRLVEGATAQKKPNSSPEVTNVSTEVAQDEKKNSLNQNHKSLPNTWRETVDLWAQSHPLQARIFQDTYELKFSADEITVAVDATSLAGSKLLQPDIQSKIARQFHELFGFHGKFRAQATDFAAERRQADAQVDAPSSETVEIPQEQQNVTETVREEKLREKDAERQALKQRLISDPVTQIYVKQLNTSVEDVELS